MHTNEQLQEREVLRSGGLAGVVGGVLFLVVFAIVIRFVGTEALAATDGEQWVQRFPDIRVARTVENTLYLVALMLWMAHFVALYRALRAAGRALFGTALGSAGLVVLAAGALPHVATAPISDLYHAPGATLEEQATLALMWQATQGIFDALLLVGLVLLPTALICLGVAMFAAPAYGKGVGGLTVALGSVGIAAAGVALVTPTSPVAAVGVFALIAFHLAVGWRTYRA